MSGLGNGARRLGRSRGLLTAVMVLGLAGLVATAAPGSASMGLVGGTSDLTGNDPLTQIASAKLPSAATTGDLRPSSAVTVSGSGKSAGIKVKVSQTTNLVNQAISISWTGAPASADAGGNALSYYGNYLQMMQCWGDTSPDRSQCEFGAKVNFDARGGQSSRETSRYLTNTPLDPLEPLTKDHPSAFVQFTPEPAPKKPITGSKVLSNPYFDQTTTNELPYVLTSANGTGFTNFETQTFREAPGLGCGSVAKAGSYKGKVAPCWLVIVPRGLNDVDGQHHSTGLETSPLSTSNWANRIVIKLTFQPAAQVCPIGAEERPVIGTESIAEAIFRWQPVLCRNKGPVFSYTETPDSVGEFSVLTDGNPKLSMLNAPISPSLVPPDRSLTYAPVAVSGIGLAFAIDYQTDPSAPTADQIRNGQRVTEINLTPRLVAKLLTQSYTTDAGSATTYLGKNPSNLTRDPDFLASNPKFSRLQYSVLPLLTPIVIGDANSTLWRWIASDRDARDFVAGLPDRWGMRINPFYQGTSIPRDDFPKIDPYCQYGVTSTGAPGFVFTPLCTLDVHPYTQDFHEAARSVSRGDYLSKTDQNISTKPYGWKKAPLRLNGQYDGIGVSDTATADRFGLLTAKLRNASGAYVGPTRAGLKAGLATMQKTSVSGVLTSNPETTSKKAYPLTTISYAVTAPNQLTKAAAKDYALLIRYAVGNGQKRGSGLGNLPDGYLPLTNALRKRALSVANDVQSRRGPAKSTDSGGPSNGGSGGGAGGGGGSPGAGAGSPTPTVQPTGAAVVPANAIGNATLFTPGDPKVQTKYVLMALLTLGCCALIFGLLLPRLARRLGDLG